MKDRSKSMISSRKSSIDSLIQLEMLLSQLKISENFSLNHNQRVKIKRNSLSSTKCMNNGLKKSSKVLVVIATKIKVFLNLQLVLVNFLLLELLTQVNQSVFKMILQMLTKKEKFLMQLQKVMKKKMNLRSETESTQRKYPEKIDNNHNVVC